MPVTCWQCGNSVNRKVVITDIEMVVTERGIVTKENLVYKCPNCQ